ncbi:DUF5994 family protein [Streptomyces sp. KHY 26]|uniref:DUF5994 family protein n=1 Tax=Streptomyces sp. KHY 26 TaxID=3097359 RepID=UPI00376EBE83
MTKLRERKNNRKAVLRCLYGAVERNRPDVSGSSLRAELGLADEDLSAACAYLADEGLIDVDWTSHRTPAAVSLTHEGIRLMEEQEEERTGRTREPSGAPADTDTHTYRMPLPRVALTPDVSHGPLDGAWWPRCDALELELPSLVSSLEPEPETAVRVTVYPGEWPDAPHAVMSPDREIAVEQTGPGGEAHAITLDCGTVGRWVLLVVPPEEPVGTAARLLAAAADPENSLTAARMLALAETGRLGGTAEVPE